MAVDGTGDGATGMGVFVGGTGVGGIAVGGTGVALAGAAVGLIDPGVSVTASTVGTLVPVPSVGGTAESMAAKVGLSVEWPAGFGNVQPAPKIRITSVAAILAIVCFIIYPVVPCVIKSMMIFYRRFKTP